MKVPTSTIRRIALHAKPVVSYALLEVAPNAELATNSSVLVTLQTAQPIPPAKLVNRWTLSELALQALSITVSLVMQSPRPA